MKYFSSFSLWLALLSGCGQMNMRGDHVLHLAQPSSGGNASQSQDDAAYDQLRAFLELYVGKDGITREGLVHLFAKYPNLIRDVLRGTQISADQLVNILFQFDSDHNNKLTVAEVMNGINDKLPILRWIPDGGTVDSQQLQTALEKEYPSASSQARAGLEKLLFQFDLKWAGGNQDGLLSRQELAAAGLVLAVLGDTNFEDLRKTNPNLDHDTQQRMDEVRCKLNQQIFGRYDVADIAVLSSQDLKLEGMQISLEYYLVDQLTHLNSYGGKIPLTDAQTVLSLYGPKQLSHWSMLRAYYDSALTLGNGDQNLNTGESLNLLTDLDFAQRILDFSGGNLSSRYLPYASRTRILAAFQVLFPTTAKDLFQGDHPGTFRPEFWDTLMTYDQVRYGGDNNGALDAGEMALAIANARVVDVVFQKYDKNKDGELSREEARSLFAQLAGSDASKSELDLLIDAYYAGVGLDNADTKLSFLQLLEDLISIGIGSSIQSLKPHEFYDRFRKVFPRVFSTNSGTIDANQGAI